MEEQSSREFASADAAAGVQDATLQERGLSSEVPRFSASPLTCRGRSSAPQQCLPMSRRTRGNPSARSRTWGQTSSYEHGEPVHHVRRARAQKCAIDLICLQMHAHTHAKLANLPTPG